MSNNLAPNYPPKPERFFRITDSRSFIKFGYYGTESTEESVGFDVGYSTRYIDLSHRLTPYSVTSHLQWSPFCEWKGLISVCGTLAKAQAEVKWRQYKNRQDIAVYEISTGRLKWGTIRLNSQTCIDILIDDAYSEPVVFIKATELIRAFGLSGELKREAERGAQEEWVALEWIPIDLIQKACIDNDHVPGAT